ncbi:MAG: hypothetical protein AAF322_02210, partial [Pseudomonadota bacterium]
GGVGASSVRPALWLLVYHLSGFAANPLRGSEWPCGTLAGATLPPAASPAPAGHLGRRAGLVEKDEARRVQIRLKREPGLAPGDYVGALLHARVRRPFF